MIEGTKLQQKRGKNFNKVDLKWISKIYVLFIISLECIEHLTF